MRGDRRACKSLGTDVQGLLKELIIYRLASSMACERAFFRRKDIHILERVRLALQQPGPNQQEQKLHEGTEDPGNECPRTILAEESSWGMQ